LSSLWTIFCEKYSAKNMSYEIRGFPIFYPAASEEGLIFSSVCYVCTLCIWSIELYYTGYIPKGFGGFWHMRCRWIKYIRNSCWLFFAKSYDFTCILYTYRWVLYELCRLNIYTLQMSIGLRHIGAVIVIYQRR
jgi:hypothetical protein